MVVLTKSNVKLANETRYTPKELGLFYVAYITVILYIQWDQFIKFRVSLPKTSHQVPSNFMLFFKRLYLNCFTIVPFLTLKVVLGDHPTDSKQSQLSSNINFQIQPSNEHKYCCTKCLWPIKNNIYQLMHHRFGRVSIERLKQTARKGLMEGLPKNIPDLE